MPALNYDDIRAFLLELAAATGPVVLEHFRTDVGFENKDTEGGYDPVTIADRAVETLIRDRVRARFPTHGVSGEELAAIRGDDPVEWIVDPIDGTKAYLCGLPTWGTLIAVCEDGEPRLGMMNQPYVGECFLGGQGRSELIRDGTRYSLHTATTDRLADATLFATAPDMFAAGLESESFQRLSAQTRMTRFGFDCYAYCMLAAGRIDLVVEAGLGFYDIAALIPIVEAAGGVVCDWSGNPVRNGGRVIASANDTLLAAALATLHA